MATEIIVGLYREHPDLMAKCKPFEVVVTERKSRWKQGRADYIKRELVLYHTALEWEHKAVIDDITRHEAAHFVVCDGYGNYTHNAQWKEVAVEFGAYPRSERDLADILNWRASEKERVGTL